MLWYSEQFYRDLEDARHSAGVIVPLILDFVQPKSVVDIGCGPGVWLSVFREHGVEDIWGVDGEYLDKKLLRIPPERFTTFDLTGPVQFDRTFDLVVSIEVAEHLPAPSAPLFVDSLVKLGNIILFSAAIPFQGGTNHVNEQWQDYWADHFRKRGYVAIDCLRNKLWNTDVSKVKRIYAQNMLVYARSEALANHPRLKAEFEKTHADMLSIVHPKVYASKIASPPPEVLSLSYALSILPQLIKNAFLRRFKKVLSYFQNVLPSLRAKRSHSL
jgi:SAM-dependent methyltransferase